MTCKRKAAYADYSHKDLIEMDPEVYLENSNVFASDLIWEPLAGQQEQFEAPRPLYGNILLTKLRENQEIDHWWKQV